MEPKKRIQQKEQRSNSIVMETPPAAEWLVSWLEKYPPTPSNPSKAYSLIR
jgi:hypothetical protein